MAERPLIVSAPLIKPIQQDRKIETRRLNGLEEINEYPERWAFVGFAAEKDLLGRLIAVFSDDVNMQNTKAHCPYGQPGDTLWVRENWYVGNGYDGIKPRNIPKGRHIKRGYMADGEKPEWAGRTWPSIFMPRWLSRMNLEVLEIDVQRLHDITEEAARKEGAEKVWHDANGTYWIPDAQSIKLVGEHGNYRTGFESIWITLNGQQNWDTNPWVWVIKFKRLPS